MKNNPAHINSQRSSLGKALLAMTKPRLNFLVVLTAMGGFELGRYESPFPFWSFFHLSVGTAILAGASAALNMWMERDSDSRMDRTRSRPLPAGQISPLVAVLWGSTLSVIGLVWLYLGTNTLTAILGAATLLSYLAVYTPSKRMSALSTWIGAVPGALPPVMGWTAATGGLGDGAAVLFAILFFWQIPHFLAIAWMYRDDYAKGGLVVAPNLESGDALTGRQAVIHSIALLIVSLSPTLVGLTGKIYFSGAIILGLIFIAVAAAAAKSAQRSAARRMLLTSVLYLPLLFTLMLMDKSF